MNRYFLDTSFVIALLNPSDQYHTIAKEIEREFDENDHFVYTDAIVFESLNSLCKTYSRQIVWMFFETLTSSNKGKLLHTSPELFQESFILYKERSDKEWGLVDCLSFLVMQKEQIFVALTSDSHFEQAGFTALLRSKR